jgi:hypothetical protein
LWPGAGQFIAVGSAGTGVAVKVSAAETDGLCTVWEGRVPPETLGTGPHSHHGRDGFFYVLEGEVVLRVGHERHTACVNASIVIEPQDVSRQAADAEARRRRHETAPATRISTVLKRHLSACAVAIALMLSVTAPAQDARQPGAISPLTLGDTFVIRSDVLHEERRINVYRPAAYADSPQGLPVLYMPDGGLAEDFLHVAGLVQVSTGNGTMRPFLLVGIENTQRRRDLTGPTDNADDKKIAPQVGGS